MRRRLLLPLAFVIACSRETAVPTQDTQTPSPQPATTTVTTSAPATTAAPLPSPTDVGTYDAALTWLRSNSGFQFTLRDGKVTAEGEMKRERVGMETVTFRAEEAEWRGVSGPRGVVWSRRDGGSWKETTPPVYAGRLWQHVTLAFDPQKREGSAQLASTSDTTNLYRFTDANTGRVHELRVRKDNAKVESLLIGSDVELTIR